MTDLSSRSKKRSPGPPTTSPVFRSGKAPLYHELANWLEQKLQSGEYSSGEKIPGDAQLANQLGVSIITVRAAMKVLIEKRLIARFAGKGTFVLENNGLSAVWGLGSIEDLIAIGFRSYVKLLDIGNIVAPKWVAAKFSQTEKKRIFWCRTLRTNSQEPFVVTDVYLPANIGAALKKINLSNALKKKRLVNTIVQEVCGIFIADIHQRMGAELADDRIAKILKIPEGTPLLTVDRYYYTQDGTLVQIGRAHHRVDHYKYAINLKRVSSA